MVQKRPGRPKMPKGEALDAVLQTRVRKDEAKAIRAAASAAGMSVSEWMRERLVRASQGN